MNIEQMTSYEIAELKVKCLEMAVAFRETSMNAVDMAKKMFDWVVQNEKTN